MLKDETWFPDLIVGRMRNEQTKETQNMKIKITISKEEYDRLKLCSDMLGDICAVVAPYSRGQNITTYECVLKMDAKLRDIKKKKNQPTKK